MTLFFLSTTSFRAPFQLQHTNREHDQVDTKFTSILLLCLCLSIMLCTVYFYIPKIILKKIQISNMNGSLVQPAAASKLRDRPWFSRFVVCYKGSYSLEHSPPLPLSPSKRPRSTIDTSTHDRCFSIATKKRNQPIHRISFTYLNHDTWRLRLRL